MAGVSHDVFGHDPERSLVPLVMEHGRCRLWNAPSDHDVVAVVGRVANGSGLYAGHGSNDHACPRRVPRQPP